MNLRKAGSDLQKVDVVQVLIEAIDCANVFESCSVLLRKGEELGIMARALAATICRRS